jgi:hypothetical protein
MPSVEERLEYLEGKVGTAPTWETRLATVEKSVAAGASTKDIWDRLQAFGSVFSGLVVLGIGWWLNDKVNHALEQKRVDLEYVKEMRDLLVGFGKNDSPPEVADANAIALAAFGEAAIEPLLYRLASGADVSSLAAQKGLRLLGFSHRVAVCNRMGDVLRDRARNYTWLTDQYVIRLMADINCTESRQVLMDYQRSLADPDFASRLSENMAVDQESILKLQTELTRTLSIVHAL